MQASTTVTSKGQVTIPKVIRQQLGICQGSQIEFIAFDGHIELRVVSRPAEVLESGFGLLKESKKPIPADFDPAILAEPV